MNRHDRRPNLHPRLSIVAAFLAYAVGVRVLPYLLHETLGMPVERAYSVYPWNFSPLYALAIFGGTVFRPRVALLLPAAVYLAGDLVIAAIMGGEWGFYPGQPVTYAALTVLAACGMPLRDRRGVVPVAAAGLAGTTAFFVLTNVGVWLTGGGFSRPRTPAGLVQCFVDALPFFTPTLVSVAVFLPILYSPAVLARSERAAAQPV